MNDYSTELQRAIKETHGLAATHFETVPVEEVFQGQVAWRGDVEVFNVSGHSKAKQCFAWGIRREDGKGWDITAVLGIPPVVSPQTAVKAAIFARARQGNPPHSGTS